MIHTILALLAAAFAITDAPVFEAQKVDESNIVGNLVELSPKQVVLDTPQGKVDLDLAKLLFLLPKDGREAVSPLGSPTVWVELTDGSTLVAVQYVAQSEKAKITLTDGETLVVSVKAVRHVRLQPETPKIASEWSRILHLKADGDVLIVRNGDSVDYHQGVLRDVAEDAVKFELDRELLPIKRAKIYGFAYHHSANEKNAAPLGFFIDRNGSRWAVAQFSLGEKLTWTTPSGVQVERPLDDIKSFDFSLGKVQYLSDLKPESSVWTPFFGQGSISPALEQFYVEVLGCSLELRQGNLAQLRAGRTLIDIVPDDAAVASTRMAGANLDHLCLRVEPFDAAAIARHLTAHGVACGEEASRYGAEGRGPSVYLNDPEGNGVELKGPVKG
jgi:catechol 2,3-dioxygenase-like lactoylglutathione lyase family enzyme